MCSTRYCCRSSLLSLLPHTCGFLSVSPYCLCLAFERMSVQNVPPPQQTPGFDSALHIASDFGGLRCIPNGYMPTSLKQPLYLSNFRAVFSIQR